MVTRGPYAPSLLAAWRSWEADPDKVCDNDFPGELPDEQLYMVFVLADGGGDLEGFQIRDGAEARALLLNTALALAVAEEALRFEHRDLHWGNVLLSRVPPGEGGDGFVRHTLRGVRVACASEGLRVTLIDFTLSRMQPKGCARATMCDLEADPDMFEGPRGECQFDTYRRMRKAVKGDWSAYAPQTNALWLSYLADTLLTKKDIPLGREEKGALRAFRTRAAKLGRAGDALLDELFVGMWQLEK